MTNEDVVYLLESCDGYCLTVCGCLFAANSTKSLLPHKLCRRKTRTKKCLWEVSEMLVLYYIIVDYILNACMVLIDMVHHIYGVCDV